MKEYICTVCGIIGAGIASIFGGWTAGMTTLVICMAIDYVTGLVVAGVFKKSKKTENGALESHAGFKGLVRKCAVLLIVLVAHRIDLTIGTSYVKDAVVIGFITNECISIVENVGLMGITLPASLTKAIDILVEKSKGDDAID